MRSGSRTCSEPVSRFTRHVFNQSSAFYPSLFFSHPFSGQLDTQRAKGLRKMESVKCKAKINRGRHGRRITPRILCTLEGKLDGGDGGTGGVCGTTKAGLAIGSNVKCESNANVSKPYLLFLSGISHSNGMDQSIP